jgi:hypothetical protein
MGAGKLTAQSSISTFMASTPTLTTVTVTPGALSGTWNLVTVTTKTTTSTNTQIVTTAQMNAFIASLPAGTIVNT